MKIGTRSVLFGAHQFLIHPVFVAYAWWRLYGIPLDPRLWIAFIVHDLGYLGKPNMDGPEGEKHPIWAAEFMHGLFGHEWWLLCIGHSRFYAKKIGITPSPLCMADKLAVALEPVWLYLPRVILTGEIKEYMSVSIDRAEIDKTTVMMVNAVSGVRVAWIKSVKVFLEKWAYDHRNLEAPNEDTGV